MKTKRDTMYCILYSDHVFVKLYVCLYSLSCRTVHVPAIQFLLRSVYIDISIFWFAVKSSQMFVYILMPYNEWKTLSIWGSQSGRLWSTKYLVKSETISIDCQFQHTLSSYETSINGLWNWNIEGDTENWLSQEVLNEAIKTWNDTTWKLVLFLLE